MRAEFHLKMDQELYDFVKQYALALHSTITAVIVQQLVKLRDLERRKKKREQMQ